MRFFIAGFSGMLEEMVGDSDQRITCLLFCGPHFPASHNYMREYVQNYPFIKVDDVPFDDVPAVIGNYDICIVKNMQLNADVISCANRTKLIMQYGVGLEGVDINAATKHGIKSLEFGGVTGNAASCAEMAIYLMLGLLRKQNEMHIAVKQKVLGEPVGETLLGKKKLVQEQTVKTVLDAALIISVVIQKIVMPGVKMIVVALLNLAQNLIILLTHAGVHYGIWKHWDSVGKTLAPIWCENPCYKTELGLVFAKFMQVQWYVSFIIFDGMPSASPTQIGMNDDLVDEKGGHEDIHTFASNADIVVCCLSMNSETAGIVNKTFISSMKKETLGKNHFRGSLLVHYHLKSGHLGGLGMDVAWTEPFDPDDPILKLSNVLITPHVAGVTEHSYRSTAKL
ncbi:hypothetical protein CsSME_00048989 [Camellia sinensis var. sinensis]